MITCQSSKQTDTKTAGKKKYKVTNWSAYNKGLKQRGRLEIWLDTDIINQMGRKEIYKYLKTLIENIP